MYENGERDVCFLCVFACGCRVGREYGVITGICVEYLERSFWSRRFGFEFGVCYLLVLCFWVRYRLIKFSKFRFYKERF